MNYNKLDACVTSERGKQVDLANAKIVTTQPHPGCPFLLINGIELEDDSAEGLLAGICDAISGTKPESCSNASYVSPEKKLEISI